jgi:hypothetical protein
MSAGVDRGGYRRSADMPIVVYTTSCAVVLEARQPVDRAGAVENAQHACASSEGWRVQWESDPPRQQSEAS